MDSSTPSPTDRLLRKIERLEATIEALEHRAEKLEVERHELMAENRKLRREATLVRLYEDLGSRSTDPSDDVGVPQSARELYRALPVAFTFPQFFTLADQHGMDTQEARGCLRFLLKRRQLVQTGSRLTKQDDPPERSQSDGASSLFPKRPPRMSPATDVP